MGIPELLIVVFVLLVPIALVVLVVVFLVCALRTMLVYLKGGPAREDRLRAARTLGEALRERRIACGMTQEFVAEVLGVTRQAVSRWEGGRSDPSTSNLIAVARLYGVPAEELSRSAESARPGGAERSV